MREYKTDIIIFLGLLILALAIWIMMVDAIDFQVHDTYFVFDRVAVVVLVLGPLTFLIFLVRGIITKFKLVSTVVGLMVGIALLGLIVYRIIQVWSFIVSN